MVSTRRVGVRGEEWPRPPQLKATITQEHIDTAMPRNSGHCMIADAIKDAYPTATWISVDLATIRFTDENAGFRYIYLTPSNAQKALIDWDAGEKIEPFSIRQSAAQVVMTGAAKRRRKDAAEKTEKTNAFLMPPKDAGGGSVPVKAGGRSLPKSDVLTGSTRTQDKRVPRGTRREFGLRQFIR